MAVTMKMVMMIRTGSGSRCNMPDKSVACEVRIWMKPSGKIAVACRKEGFISTVSNDPNSKRFHPNLYSKLAEVLRNHGRISR